MSMIQMTVTQALRERKVLKDRITSAIHEGVYVSVVEGESLKPSNKAYKTANDLVSQIQGSTDKVEALIKRYNHIVDALIRSNAITTVTVAGETMTVAAAIERRNSHSMTQMFLQTIGQQYAAVAREVDSKQRSLNVQIENRVANNKTESMDAAQVAQLVEDSKKVLEKEYLPQIFDPSKNAENLQVRRDRAEKFSDELETQLNIINATTMIEIPA